MYILLIFIVSLKTSNFLLKTPSSSLQTPISLAPCLPSDIDLALMIILLHTPWHRLQYAKPKPSGCRRIKPNLEVVVSVWVPTRILRENIANLLTNYLATPNQLVLLQNPKQSSMRQRKGVGLLKFATDHDLGITAKARRTLFSSSQYLYSKENFKGECN